MNLRLWFKTIAIVFSGTTIFLSVISAPAIGKELNNKSQVYVGIDAEFGHASSTSAQAIRLGMQLAIDEINSGGGVLGGRQVKIIEKDNRSIAARAMENLKELAEVENLVAVFCGKFSPTVLQALPLIHERRLIMLNPWAAADPITDNGYSPNYVFRLSLRDSWAMPKMLQHAASRRLFNVGVLVPNTAWGRSNHEAMQSYLRSNRTIKVVGTHWFNHGDQSLLEKYLALENQGAQAIILVANEPEGSILVREIASLAEVKRLPIISHWGITGGNFPQLTGPALHQVDLSVVQTYSFLGRRTARAEQVIRTLKTAHGLKSERELHSPVGVAHAYDLMHLLAIAINKAGTTDRSKVRDALERIDRYDGLVKVFNPPFTPKRHDALDIKDVFMATYARDGAIVRREADRK